MIPLPHAPKVVSKEGQKAVFEVEALYPGYGVTLGNSLRRVLLSSLEGWAPTQVKIKGVQHEFSTIPGVLEDIVLITLNLKKLRFRVFGEEPQKAILKVKGEKEVKGKDFALPPQVELVNEDVHIATLTSKSSELDMEISIEKGLGYRSRESRRKQEKLEVGTISLDAIFTPVRRVGFRVENMRVGDRTDYDRLFLEVGTDGTINPEQALERAARVLCDHFSLVAETYKQVEGPKEPKAAKSPKRTKKAKTLKKHAEKKKGKKAK